MSTFLRLLPRWFNKLRRLPAPGGFTLIELMVVTLIMVLITSVILVRQARFDSATLLRSLSYSIALSIRSAQVYGTSVRGATVAGLSDCTNGSYQNGTCYAGAYGVSFNAGDAGGYTLFADADGDGAYTGADVRVQKFTIGAGFQIRTFCAVNSGGVQECSSACPAKPLSIASSCTPATLDSLVIYFKRPNPDALFSGNSGETYSAAYIQVNSKNDPTNTHAVEVTSTGEIAVLPAGS